MNTLFHPGFRRPRRPLVTLACLCLTLAAPLAACGDAEEAPSSGGGSANDDLEAVSCTAPPKQTFDATTVIGQSVEDATRRARDAGCAVRVVIEDGKPLAVTMDYRPDRINVVVADDAIEKIDGIY